MNEWTDLPRHLTRKLTSVLVTLAANTSTMRLFGWLFSFGFGSKENQMTSGWRWLSVWTFMKKWLIGDEVWLNKYKVVSTTTTLSSTRTLLSLRPSHTYIRTNDANVPSERSIHIVETRCVAELVGVKPGHRGGVIVRGNRVRSRGEEFCCGQILWGSGEAGWCWNRREVMRSAISRNNYVCTVLYVTQYLYLDTHKLTLACGQLWHLTLCGLHLHCKSMGPGWRCGSRWVKTQMN